MKENFLTIRKTLIISGLLFSLLLVASLFSISVGAVAIPFRDVIKFLTGETIDASSETILLSIRLPRVLLAIVVGGGLSVAGVVFQALLRNPLAEPFILGVSSGGTFGAVLVISFGVGASLVSIPAASFIGALIVMVVVYSIAEKYGQVESTTLLLTGIMVGAFFNAMILFTIAIRHQEARGAILWLMGNLSNADLQTILIVGPVILVAIFIVFLFSRQYNLIATGEETASHLGIEVEKLKKISYLLASLITGLAVSVSGVIGFVGLIIPHICRMIFGADHRILIPSSFLVGATFLILVDTVARTAISPSEIPVGAVTALVGAPIFIWLLRRRSY